VTETSQQRSQRAQQPESSGCEAELHVRLCARRLSTGHLQFRWRVEHVDNIDQTGDSLEGTFSPFVLPHEAGQEVAAAVRAWWKTAHDIARKANDPTERDLDGEQLTLRGFLTDS
jgi:hypothetical protein